MQTDAVVLKNYNSRFAREINALAGTNINLCWHCRCCAGGCPFVEAMDYHPNELIRLAQLGMHEEALKCRTIWICVGCHTCSAECPNAIDIAAVMDAIRQEAIQKVRHLPEKNILVFHRQIIESIRRHGRTNKMEIMFHLKMRTIQWFGDINLGFRMLMKGKLDFKPSKVKNLKELRKLFEK